nr:MAG TPA: SECRETED 45 KDA PROTEIN CYCLE, PEPTIDOGLYCAN, CHAP, CELL [Caudoviricetes sp.]
MWNKTKVLFVGLLLLLLPLSVSLAESPSTTVSSQPEQTVKMPITRYNNLKMKIAQLELNLNVLEQNSNVDKQELDRLKKQLMDCEDAMNKAQQSLATAAGSSEKLEKNLETLTKQMDSLKHKLQVKNRQNKTGWIVAGVLLGAFIAK